MAVIDDQSVARWEKISAEKKRGRLENQPRFTSLIASYGEFGKDSRLLHAWHSAIKRVVSGVDDGHSMVGDSHTYDLGCLTRHWGKRAPREMLYDGEQPRVQSCGDESIALYWADYAFGATTSADASGRTAEIADVLMSCLEEEALVRINEINLRQTLETSQLFVIPFRRPAVRFLSGALSLMNTTPNELRSQLHEGRRKLHDRPGGCLFLLIDTRGGTPTLDQRQQLVFPVLLIMQRAAMLELRTEWEVSRASELSQFTHSLATAHLKLKRAVRRARESAVAQQTRDDELLTRMDAAVERVERLDELGKYAARAYLANLGLATPLRFDERITLTKLVDRCRTMCEEFVDGHKRLVNSDSLVSFRGHNARLVFSSNVRENVQLLMTDINYCGLCLSEIIKNALDHGDYRHDNRLLASLESKAHDSQPEEDQPRVWLRVSNPFDPSGDAEGKLRKSLSERRFSLGFAQLDSLATAWNLPLPAIDVNETRFLVTFPIATVVR